MTAQETFKRFVTDELGAVLKGNGFRKKGFTFHRRSADTCGVIQLQKSRHSTASSISFTINVSVFSERVQRVLSALMWMPEVVDVPMEAACHVRRRIGSLMPQRQDPWWTIGDVVQASELGAVIRLALEDHAFPFLDALSSDAGVRSYLAQHRDSSREGLVLAVLIRDLGPEGDLEPLLARLRVEASGASGFLAAVNRLGERAAT